MPFIIYKGWRNFIVNVISFIFNSSSQHSKYLLFLFIKIKEKVSVISARNISSRVTTGTRVMGCHPCYIPIVVLIILFDLQC